MQGRSVASGRVYVIDDAPPVRRALERALSERGYTVTTYQNAEAFFRVAHLEEPAVLVLDMRMPGMSGAELMRRLQARGRDMPIVFVSGESRPDEIVEVMKRGAIDFLVKPFPTEALLAAVGSALERARTVLDARERSARARALLNELTPRELEVCSLIVRGYANRDVAAHLALAPATAKSHRARILEKMQVQTVPQLVSRLEGITLPVPDAAAGD